MFDDLNEKNIMLFAAKCYDNPSCLDSEFEEDYKRIQYIKRLLTRYRTQSEMKERLILNHLVVVQNVFGVAAATRLLFFNVDVGDYSALKTFLIYTSAMPEVVKGIRKTNIISCDIPLDWHVVEKLRKL
jgi:hypothetical protein